MSPDTRKTVHRIYGAVLSLLILVLGVCFILSCIDIYRSGDRPFSPESIGAHFRAIRIPVLFTVLLVFGGIVLSVALPTEREKPKAVRDGERTLCRMQARVPASVPTREPHLRRILRTVTALLTVLLAVYPAVYLGTEENFTLADLNGSVRSAAVTVLVPTAIAFALAVLCTYLCAASVRRETAAYQSAVAEQKQRGNAAESVPAPAPTAKDRLRAAFRTKETAVRFVFRAVILVAAVLLIVLGILNGGIDDVLGKAALICTECIGLG